MYVKQLLLIGFTVIGFTIVGFGCQSDEPDEDTAAWWQTEYDCQEDSEDETDDKDSGFDTSYEDCPEDFDPGAACEGTWEETICVFDDLTWWCETGVWMNEDDQE